MKLETFQKAWVATVQQSFLPTARLVLRTQVRASCRANSQIPGQFPPTAPHFKPCSSLGCDTCDPGTQEPEPDFPVIHIQTSLYSSKLCDGKSIPEEQLLRLTKSNKRLLFFEWFNCLTLQSLGILFNYWELTKVIDSVLNMRVGFSKSHMRMGTEGITPT